MAKGSIKFAEVAISYKRKKPRSTLFETVITKPVKIVIVVIEENGKRTLKFKKIAINRVCDGCGLKYDKLIEPNINSINILADLGKTSYEVWEGEKN